MICAILDSTIARRTLLARTQSDPLPAAAMRDTRELTGLRALAAMLDNTRMFKEVQHALLAHRTLIHRQERPSVLAM